jgi:hypothetical protein
MPGEKPAWLEGWREQRVMLAIVAFKEDKNESGL